MQYIIVLVLFSPILFWLILYNQLTLTKFGKSLPLYINTIKTKEGFFFVVEQ